ncbi:MAG: DNA polymerase III subunit delta [Gemmatimonadaceae bacterium]
MSIAEERELQRSIKQRQFPHAYYFHGASDFLKDTAVRDLVSSAVDPSTRDFNLDQVHAADVTAETLEALINTPPMMADRRVTVVREVHALRKDARLVLDLYLQRPSRDLLLVLVDDAEAKEDKVLSMHATAVEFEALSHDRLVKWVHHYAASTLGAPIDEEAVDLLLNVVGSDLPQLAAELEKLSNYTAGMPIDRDVVGAVVGVRHGETVADLLDAVAIRNAARALELVPYVLQQPKVSVVTVLMSLSTQMLAIAWGRAARARGLPQRSMEREFIGLLKESRAFPGRPWGEAVRIWSQAISLWDDASLGSAIDALLQADRAAKETRLSSEEQLLSNVILAMCGTPQQAAA